MAPTNLTTGYYPIRAGIVAARLHVFDPCTRKAKLGAKKGFVTQGVGDAQYTANVEDGKTIEIESADPYRVNNGRWIFPPLQKGGTLDLTFNPGIHEAEALWSPGANILRSSTVIGWVDYVGAMAEMIGVEVWRHLFWGPYCVPGQDLVEREVYLAGYPNKGAQSLSKGDGDAESMQVTFELQPLSPPAPVVLTGSATTSGSPTVTVSSTTALSAGDLIAGTGVPVGTRILSITDATTLVMTANATATGGSVSLTFTYGGPFGDWPDGVLDQMTAANAANKDVFRLRFGEADLPASLTGFGFLTIT